MILVSENEYRRLKRLEEAVYSMVTQRGDNLCWRDLYTQLAPLVGIEFVPEMICDKKKMLANCERFVDSLMSGEQYKPIFVEVNSNDSDSRV